MYILHYAKLYHAKINQWAMAFLAVILLAGATASYAQTYTLTIRNGDVYVNGKQLPKDEIPATLDAESLDANLSFSGPAIPTFEIDGNYYKIENYKLIDVTTAAKADDRTTVVFRNEAPAESPVARVAPQSRAASEDRADAYGRLRERVSTYKNSDGDPNVVMQQYVIELNQNARQLNEMSESLSQRQAQDLIQQVQMQAEQAAQLAQDMPYLEMQRYFAAVRAEDELLYQRLVSELELERETQRLAAEARQLPEGDERNFKIEELREMLGSILELKQENRRLEINQLEKQLSILKQRFEDREAKKDRLIDRRITELVGDSR